VTKSDVAKACAAMTRAIDLAPNSRWADGAKFALAQLLRELPDDSRRILPGMANCCVHNVSLSEPCEVCDAAHAAVMGTQ
jgi:hypothetical protein